MNEDRNIVLIGMPSAGKSIIGKRLSFILMRPFYQCDNEAIIRIGMPIADYFRLYGEEAFRDVESSIIAELSVKTGIVISCGGGVIKRPENMDLLSKNGLIIYLKRDLDKLEASPERPLASNRRDLEKIYHERKEIYERYADLIIDNNGPLEESLEAILNNI